MKISNITSKIFTNVLPHKKIEYTKIPIFDTFEHDALNKVYEAKGMLDNYAKSKGIQIDIFDPRSVEIGEEKLLESDINSNLLGVNVKDLKSGQIISRNLQIFGDKDQVIKETTTPVMVNCLEDPDTQRIVRVKSFKEFNFLKYLYSNIEEMANSLIK